MRYPVVIHKDPGSSYGVTVPDLPGCFSGGDTLDEAFDNAREAIVGHIETFYLREGDHCRQWSPSRSTRLTKTTGMGSGGGSWILTC